MRVLRRGARKAVRTRTRTLIYIRRGNFGKFGIGGQRGRRRRGGGAYLSINGSDELGKRFISKEFTLEPDHPRIPLGAQISQYAPGGSEDGLDWVAGSSTVFKMSKLRSSGIFISGNQYQRRYAA